MVVYKGKNLISFLCERIGHNAPNCPHQIINTMKAIENASEKSMATMTEAGPWMVVPKSKRKNSQQ